MLPKQLLTTRTPLIKWTLLLHICTSSTPDLLLIPMVAHAEEYLIPFPSYMDKKSYIRVVEDEMFIRNHDFDKTAELVWLDL